MINRISGSTIDSQLRKGFLFISSIVVLACTNSNAPETHMIHAASDSLCIGSIQITVSTTSAEDDVDRDGYTVSIDSGNEIAIGINDILTTAALKKGSHLVRLSGIALNCSTSATDRWVDVVSDKLVVPVSFSVSCSNYWDY